MLLLSSSPFVVLFASDDNNTRRLYLRTASLPLKVRAIPGTFTRDGFNPNNNRTAAGAFSLPAFDNE